MNGETFPLVTGFLMDKERTTYERFFGEIIDRLPNGQGPTLFISDLESSLMSCLRTFFPNIQHQVCLFHVCQATYRRLGEEHLIDQYKTSPEFKLSIRKLWALSFVPVDEVREHFLHLRQPCPDQAVPIYNYFREMYVDGRRPIGRPRANALFPPALWNVRDRVLQDQPRTTNACEAYNRRLGAIFAKHTGVTGFLTNYKKECQRIEGLVERKIAGNPGPLRKKADRERDQRIKAVTQDYGNRTIDDYLRGIAHNLLLE